MRRDRSSRPRHAWLMMVAAVLLLLLTGTCLQMTANGGASPHAPALTTAASALLVTIIVAQLGYILVLRLNQSQRPDSKEDTLRRESAKVGDALRESEAKLRTLVKQFPQGAVFMFDHDLRYIVADGLVLEGIGQASERLEGKTLAEAMGDEGAIRFLEPIYRKTLAGEPVSEVEMEVNGRSFRLFPSPVRDDRGTVIAGMIITFDITATRRAEEEQRRMERKLQDAQRLESLGLLAGGVAHDLNNLLAAILSHAEAVRMDVQPGSEAAESVDAIIMGTSRASELTNQLLAYAGKGRFTLRPVSLNEVLREVGELLRLSIGKHARLAMHLCEAMPAIAADTGQLRQVALNLLVNAAESLDPSKQGTITITTTVERLEGDALKQLAPSSERAPGPYVCLTVKDEGCGMDEETLTRIFEPFFTTKFTGRGLGLAAVHGIVRGHGGLMKVESVPSAGTTFRIWFPALESAAIQPEPVAKPAPMRRGAILVVDDEPPVRAALSRVLKRLGYEVQTASDGPSALDALRAGIPDLLVAFIDVTMPLVTGDALARSIHEVRPDIPIILMSGYTVEDIVTRYGDIHHVAFLHKPFTLDTLNGALQDALRDGPAPSDRGGRPPALPQAAFR